MLVCPPGGEDVLLDFFVEAPGRGREHGGRAPLVAVDVSFGDANQIFHVGAASVGAYGMPAGHLRGAPALRDVPLARAGRPRRRGRARGRHGQRPAGVPVRDPGRHRASPPPRRARRYGSTGGRRARATWSPTRSSPTTLERLAAEGERRSTPATSPPRSCRAVARGGGVLTPRDLARTRPHAREPVRVAYRGREVVTNPPPSAGGILIAAALEELDAEPGAPARRWSTRWSTRSGGGRRSSSSGSARRPTSP